MLFYFYNVMRVGHSVRPVNRQTGPIITPKDSDFIQKSISSKKRQRFYTQIKYFSKRHCFCTKIKNYGTSQLNAGFKRQIIRLFDIFNDSIDHCKSV